VTGDRKHHRCVLFDWGDTLMRDFPEFSGALATWPRVESLPCAREALDTLRSRGWLVVLATNAVDSDEAAIWEALRRSGLGDSLDRIYCFRNVGHRKPDPAFFDFVLQDLGLGRSEVVMVGDDFDVDVAGANAAGLRAVWLSPDSEQARSAGTHRMIRDLASLPDLLERWESERA